ncbi:MAG TPA: hypothetical protein VH763_11830 [Gemmatimonadales bacterium]|jgi:hypothetical protein
MRRTNLSLIYVAAYLLVSGIFLVLAPGLALQLLLSTGDYGEIFPRLGGLLLLGLGILVAQIVRYRITALYPTTLAVRVVFCLGFVVFYFQSRDPLFLVLLGVVGIGVVATSISYALDSQERDRSGT